MQLARILVIEDNPDIRTIVRMILEAADFAVIEANCGTTALEILAQQPIDLAIIDLGLPDMNGLDLTRQLAAHSSCGIIILSGRADAVERVVGLEAGADDFVAKPFERRELVARVRSVLRRRQAQSIQTPAKRQAETINSGGAQYDFAGWRLEPTSRTLRRPDGGIEDLTQSEYNLLLTLVERAGRVLTREQLLDATHGKYTPALDRSVDVQIGRLRRRIEPPKASEPVFIRTIRNGGYMFCAKVTKLTD
jgi:two-component system OmpR family response regulator